MAFIGGWGVDLANDVIWIVVSRGWLCFLRIWNQDQTYSCTDKTNLGTVEPARRFRRLWIRHDCGSLVYTYFRLQHSCFKHNPDKLQTWNPRRVHRAIKHIKPAGDWRLWWYFRKYSSRLTFERAAANSEWPWWSKHQSGSDRWFRAATGWVLPQLGVSSQ